MLLRMYALTCWVTGVLPGPCILPSAVAERAGTSPMQVVGTRGDVQPFLAIARELRRFGHRVRLATHAVYRNFVEGNEVEFFPLGGDPAVLSEFVVRNRGIIPGGGSKSLMQDIRAQVRSAGAAPELRSAVYTPRTCYMLCCAVLVYPHHLRARFAPDVRRAERRQTLAFVSVLNVPHQLSRHSQPVLLRPAFPWPEKGVHDVALPVFVFEHTAALLASAGSHAHGAQLRADC